MYSIVLFYYILVKVAYDMFPMSVSRNYLYITVVKITDIAFLTIKFNLLNCFILFNYWQK